MCISMCTLSLMSCASYYASNRDKMYLKSKNGVALVVPPPLSTNNLGYFYNLPPQNQKGTVNIKPPTL